MTEEQLQKTKRYQAEWRVLNKDKLVRDRAAWYQKNKASKNVKSIEWRDKNKERVAEHQAKWYLANSESRKAYRAKYSKEHPAEACAASAYRRALVQRATPSWGNRTAMQEFYTDAQSKSLSTGVSWHVDHIIPLRNKFVCGLHVEFNLQVIPGSANCRKSNSFLS